MAPMFGFSASASDYSSSSSQSQSPFLFTTNNCSSTVSTSSCTPYSFQAGKSGAVVTYRTQRRHFTTPKSNRSFNRRCSSEPMASTMPFPAPLFLTVASPTSSLSALGDKATENEEKAVEEAVVSSETGDKELLLPLVSISRILKGIPQNPHFLALKRYSELARKNLVSGWDRLFEETIDQIQALRVEEFWGGAAELWRTLQELQSMGYNVILLRRRLVELHDVAINFKSSKFEILRLKKKAECHKMEKLRLKTEVLKLQAQVEREQACVEETTDRAAKMERNLPEFGAAFAALALKPL